MLKLHISEKSVFGRYKASIASFCVSWSFCVLQLASQNFSISIGYKMSILIKKS